MLFLSGLGLIYGVCPNVFMGYLNLADILMSTYSLCINMTIGQTMSKRFCVKFLDGVDKMMRTIL